MRARYLPVLAFLATAIVGIGALGVATSTASTSVHLRVEGSTTTLFDGTVSVTDCSVTDTTGVEHALSSVALCALVDAGAQEGFDIEVQDFGFGLFLKRIGSDDTPADFSQSWAFWVNDDPASIGADTYAVSPDDELLLAFTSFPGIPLRVSGPAEAAVDELVSFTVEKRVGEYDDSFVWHGRWEPAEGAVLHIGDSDHAVPADGIVQTSLSSAGEVLVSADGAGFIRSSVESLAVLAPSPSVSPTPSPTPTPSVTPTPTPSPTPSPTPTPHVAGISTEDRSAKAGTALSYLRGQQGNDGSIDGSIVTAWSVIAFGADGQRAADIRNGTNSLLDALASASLHSATDIERQILAVQAAGANPRSFAGQDLVSLLKQKGSGEQIGEEALINDDIFGILALLAAGEQPGASPISQAVSTILARQEFDGSWDSIDMTAAAIQALREYARRGGSIGVSDAVSDARSYVRAHQDQYGGFGENSATTAWAIQAIVALGEDPSDWKTSSGKTPWTALAEYQTSSGGFAWRHGDSASPFMTAYAVPALLGDPLPITVLSLQEAPIAVIDSAALGGPSPTPIVRAAKSGQVVGVMTQGQSGQSGVHEGAQVASVQEGLLLDKEDMVGEALVSSAPQQVPEGFIPLTATDKNFALFAFSLASAGIGAALARLGAKFLGSTV